MVAERYKSAFSGTVLLSSLIFSHDGGSHSYFRCPCGGSGHYASRSSDFNTGKSVTASPVLHCWETGQQWLIENDIEEIIRREEDSYGKLLDKHASLAGKSVDAKDAFRLWSEQGAPIDVLDITEPEEFNRLVEDHRKKSRKK